MLTMHFSGEEKSRKNIIMVTLRTIFTCIKYLLHVKKYIYKVILLFLIIQNIIFVN